MFPEKYKFMEFEIVPYLDDHGEEYMNLMSNQWHIVPPCNMKFENEEQKEKYINEYKGFCDYINQSIKNDVASLKYRDYQIKSGEKFVGVIDVGTMFFSKPEVGIILTEEYRSKGYGYKITEDFIKRVKENMNSDKVVWRCEKTNEIAIALALKLGGAEDMPLDDYRIFLI